MTEERELALASYAVSRLTSVCDGAESKDGQGWSKAHATTGLLLGMLPIDYWDDDAIDWARQTLPIYAKQLERYGISLEGLRRPQQEVTTDHLCWITAFGEDLYVYAHAHHPVAAILNDKRSVERVYDPGPHWIVHPNTAIGGELRELIKRLHLRTSPEARAWLAEHRDPLPLASERIELGPSAFWIFFDRNNSSIMNAVRKLPGRRFEPNPNPHWELSYTREGAFALESLVREYHQFALGDEVWQQIEAAKLKRDHKLGRSEAGLTIQYPMSDNECDLAVRALPKRYFTREPFAHWVAVSHHENAQPLIDLITNFDFDVSEEADELLAYLLELARAMPPARRVECVGGRLRLYSPYDKSLVSLMHTWDGTFNKPEERYDLPITEHTPALFETLRLKGFTIAPEVVQATQEAISEAKRAYEASYANEGAGAAIVLPGGALRPFQNAGIEYARLFLHKQGGVIIGDDMGLGKTVMFIALAETEGAYPALVVVPATLKWNWKREIERWLPHRRSVVLAGKKPDATLVQGADFIIINYDILDAWKDTLIEALPSLPLFGVDEAHFVKDKTRIRTIAAREIGASARWVALMTGTPIRNRPIELWPLLELARMAHHFGGYFPYAKRYCKAYKKSIGRGQMAWDVSGASNLNELHERLRGNGMIRRMKTEVLTELAEKQRVIIPVELNNQKEYDRAERDFINWLRDRKDELDEEEGDSASLQAEAIVKMNYLRQLSGMGKVKDVVTWGRDFLEQTDEKIVIYAWHQVVQQALYDAFPGAVHLFAGDSSEMAQPFQHDPDKRVVVASISAFGFGVTLTAASKMVVVELPWAPADLEQVEDRIYRIGQEAEAVTIYNFQGIGTIDETMWAMIEAKLGVVSEALDGKRRTTGASVAKGVMQALLKRGGANHGRR